MGGDPMALHPDIRPIVDALRNVPDPADWTNPYASPLLATDAAIYDRRTYAFLHQHLHED